MISGRKSMSRLPVRQLSSQDLLAEKRQSRRTTRDAKKAEKTRASSTSRTSASMSVERTSLRRSRSSASIRQTPQHNFLPVPTSSRNRSAERLRNNRKDGRPIQDKKWQAEQMAKIQEYFLQKPEATSLFNRGTCLRPMTINLFVQLINMILHDIDEDFEEITVTNYVEKVPNNLAMLMYPQPVSSSVLKTVNAQHSWPQVLAMLSWLVDLKMLSNLIPPLFEVLPDAPPETILHGLALETYCKSFAQWNANEPLETPTEFEETARKMLHVERTRVEEAKKVIEEEKQRLRAEEKILSEKKKQIEASIEKIETLKKDCENTKEVVNKQKEHRSQLRECITDCTEDIQKLKHEIEVVQNRCQTLTEQIENQPATKAERDKILEEIEDLENKKKTELEKNMLAQKLCDENDLKLSQLKRDLDEKVHKFNMALMEPAFEHLELKELMLPESGFLKEDVLEVFEEKGRKMQELHAILETKIKDLNEELAKKNEKYTELQHSIDHIVAANTKKKETLNMKEKELEQLKKDIETEKEVSLAKVQNMKKVNIELSQSIPNLEEQEKTLRDYKNKAKEWEKKIQDYQHEGVEFFKGLNEDVNNAASVLRGFMQKITHTTNKTINVLKNPRKSTQ